MRRKALAIFLFAILLSVPASANTPPYLLSPEEIARYRTLEGRSIYDAFRGFQGESPLGRAVRWIVGRRGGKYVRSKWSVHEAFWLLLRDQVSIVAIDQGRFLLGWGCLGDCSEKSAVLADLQTGQVALALLHFYNAAGNLIGAQTTIFMMACADAAFRAAAREQFRRWAPEGDNDRVQILTTRCDASPPPQPTERVRAVQKMIARQDGRR